jgi:uncharacterized protein YdeI (YjbR/CyaY-like superfamily)
MAGVHEKAERLQIESLEQWREWLEANHEQPDGVWLVTFKKTSSRPRVDYVAMVEEALSFGWIDGTARTVDDERSMIWLAPRRKGSVWAASNRERVARLEHEGRMRPAGRAVVERAQADGSWSVLIPAERGEVPDDLAAAFAASPGSRETWEGFPPSVRLQALSSIYMAKRPETRARRVSHVAARTAAGERPV